MALVAPYRALHYDKKKIRDIADVITPPYDNIPAGEDKKYLARSPYNFAHLDLPHEKEESYAQASTTLTRWRELGIILEDANPSYYLYRQNFSLQGKSRTRDTLMAAVFLHEFSEAIVRPHENTFGQYKADRLQQLRGTHCNLSHIFAMSKESEGFLERTYEKWEYHEPLLHGTDDHGVEHVLWRIEGNRATEIQEFFSDKPLYIVDGHHRYESAVAYARETGALGKPDHPSAYTLFAIANSYDPGLVVLPTHRIVTLVDAGTLTRERIAASYHCQTLSFEEVKAFTLTVKTEPSFAIHWRGEALLLTAKYWPAEAATVGQSLSELSVYWSDRKFLAELCGVTDQDRSERVSYEKDADKAWARRAEANVIVFHAPPSIDVIAQIADEKKFMPQKSTFFYPKLAAGLTMRDFSR